MANDYFKFKRFTIHQDRCAMKVTTIACIQGAWLPDISPKAILDIGSGTGLLSLMVAQKYHGDIDAVEIEPEAYGQLADNITQSPWSSRIHAHHADINHFKSPHGKKYDFIISNPPFFTKQLQSSDYKINHARHDSSLTIIQLSQVLSQKLADEGLASVLLPPAETELLMKLAMENSLFSSTQLFISDKETKSPHAIITILSKRQASLKTKDLYIKNIDGTYTSEFISLLKAYYLSL